ncbi:protein phosphatase 2C domain-containing protein [Phytohabitans kaempferiae]|uniref:Protein phosphatase 2C domain-containing protein n=1 Tax=Phytohabitans kaempferiae TaxID=1620943 RepID=A0ABV6LUH2_9ACTN
MNLRASRILWPASIVVIASIELLVVDPRTPAVLLGVGAIVAALLAIQLEVLRVRPRVATTTGPAAPPVPPGGGVFFRPPAAPPQRTPEPPRVPASAASANGFPAPPLFGGRPSAAHAKPWLLPARPAHAAVCADEARLGHLTVRAASVVGPGHRCEEPAVARQDAYALGRDTAGRRLILAVADGLSSGRHSDIGASRAATFAVDAMRRRLDQGRELAAVEVFGEIAAHLRATAEVRRLAPEDLSTVLVVAVVNAYPDQRGVHRMWTAWIGDSAVLRHEGSAWRPIGGDTKSARDGIESNVVGASLPAEPQLVRAEAAELPPGGMVAVMTDGVGDAIRMERSAAEFFLDRWRRPPPVAEFLTHVSFQARGHQDDRTAVAVWLDAAPGGV